MCIVYGVNVLVKLEKGGSKPPVPWVQHCWLAELISLFLQSSKLGLTRIALG